MFIYSHSVRIKRLFHQSFLNDKTPIQFFFFQYFSLCAFSLIVEKRKFPASKLCNKTVSVESMFIRSCAWHCGLTKLEMRHLLFIFNRCDLRRFSHKQWKLLSRQRKTSRFYDQRNRPNWLIKLFMIGFIEWQFVRALDQKASENKLHVILIAFVNTKSSFVE